MSQVYLGLIQELPTAGRTMSIASTEAGDTLLANLANLDHIAIAVTEAGDTLAAALHNLDHVVIAATEAGDVLSGALANLDHLHIGSTEAGDTLAKNAVFAAIFGHAHIHLIL